MRDEYDGNLLLKTSPELLFLPSGLLISILATAVSNWRLVACVLAVIIILILVVFFRSPPIDKSGYDDLGIEDLVSPANGTISAIDYVPVDLAVRDYGEFIRPSEYDDSSDSSTGTSTLRRIVVFLGVHNLHFQAAPMSGVIERVTHKAGQFHPAGFLEKSQYNERVLIEMTTRKNKHIMVVLLAGILAKRIEIFPKFAEPGSLIMRGDKISVIKFGSRVDIIIPNDYDISVKVGDTVEAGETVLARLINLSS